MLIEWNKKADMRTAIIEGKDFFIYATIRTYNQTKEERFKMMLEFSQKVNA